MPPVTAIVGEGVSLTLLQPEPDMLASLASEAAAVESFVAAPRLPSALQWFVDRHFPATEAAAMRAAGRDGNNSSPSISASVWLRVETMASNFAASPSAFLWLMLARQFVVAWRKASKEQPLACDGRIAGTSLLTLTARQRECLSAHLAGHLERHGLASLLILRRQTVAVGT